MMCANGNKVAIVTGSSHGIGAAIAQRLAADGFTVVINYAGKPAEADAVVGKLKQAGSCALAVQADVGDAASVRRLFDTVEKEAGGVDVLVNNAGIMRRATLADSDDALIDSHIFVNLRGTINTLREAARLIPSGGCIINLSSSNVPADADVSAVGDAIVRVVDAPFGKRPFWVHIDPGQDGADVGFSVLDRLRAEMLHRVGLSELMTPRTP